MQVGHSSASALSTSDPTKDHELIRTLDISLLARKNSFWSFAIRQRMIRFLAGYSISAMHNSFVKIYRLLYGYILIYQNYWILVTCHLIDHFYYVL